MEKSLSFTGLEKQVLHDFRKRVNLSEDPLDLEKLFVRMVQKILQSDALSRFNIQSEDIIFDPGHDDGFRLSEKLLLSSEFRALYDHSDLGNVIGRFAQPISKRYIHLKRNPRRSEPKIR